MNRTLDVSHVTFMVTKNPAPKFRGSGEENLPMGAPDWRLQLLALGGDEAELIDVVVHGPRPAVLVGQWVSVVGLEVPKRALKPGKSLRAQEVKSLQV